MISDECFFISEQDCFQMWGHNHSKVIRTGKNRMFCESEWERRYSLCACPEFDELAYYLSVVKKTLEITLYMEKVIVLPLSLFDNNAYLLCRSSEWSKSHKLRYHVYFIPTGLQLKDAISWACGDSLVARIAYKADWVAAKVIGTYERDDFDVESSENADVLQIVSHFIFA